ncbi:MAG TPA: sialidase family protein [Gaiellaceae bacterium]|nr:sialidase family protein [Gaiellaceae bacterium]
MRHRKLVLLLGLALLAFAAFGTSMAAADDQPQPIDFVHNVSDAPAPVTGTVWANGPKVKTGQAICTTATSDAANVNTDCEENGPHNETSIAVNPTDPNNMIGGLNDYQLSINPGGHVGETVLSRAHVTFDGGRTWSEYPLYSSSTYQATGDPAVAFDADGRAYYATLGFRFVGPTNAQSADVLVANSGDGGKTWDVHRVAAGSGVETSVGDFLDKEYVAAWGHGNAIVTFGDFRQAQKGAVVSSNIYDSVTHDGGQTWSKPTKISDSLDEAFGSVPAVTTDGRIFVSFLNTPFDRLTDPTAVDYGRDDYMVQQVDPQTGAPIGTASDVGEVFDGAWDYPWAFGRTTYQDSLFRTWAFGNIAADPTDPNHLAVAWSDMRNSPGTPPLSFADPYTVTTNSDVIVSESFDGGQTWSTPAAYTIPGDQFMPWAAFDYAGTLRVGTFDRSYDPSNHEYGYSVLTGPPAAYTSTKASTALSDPTKNDRWFAATVNPSFPFATTFLGDYSNIAAIPGKAGVDHGVVAYWTDMRNDATFGSRAGHGEDGYFAALP